MSVSKDKKTGYWQYNFMYKGTRYHRRFKDAGYDDVIGYENIAKTELLRAGYDISKSKYDCPLSELVADYKSYVDNVYSRPDETKFIIDNFYKLTGNKPAEQVTLADLEKYRAKRKREGVKNSTINREMHNICRLFSLAKENKKLRINPCDDLKKLKEQKPQKRYLTKEEESKLLELANPTMKAVILLALHTGMRLSEITNLKWGDLFFEQKYLIVLNTKNGKSRELVLTDNCIEVIKGLPKISEYVFTNPITKTRYRDFKSTFARLVKKSGIPHISFHELRHTTGSRLNELGVDLATIQEYLDHSDIRTTMGYVHVRRENITSAIDKLANY